MAFNQYRSCLEPFVKEIVTFRRMRPPMAYSKIAEYLEEKHNIKVRRQTIERFIKVRAKGYRIDEYAWKIEIDDDAIQPTPAVPPVAAMPKQAVSQVSKPATISQSKLTNQSKPVITDQSKEKTNLLTNEELTAYLELTSEEQSAVDKMLPKDAKAYIQQLMAEKLKGE